MNKDQLKEQILTIKNLCDLVQLVLDNDRNYLLPTVLELMGLEIQQIIDKECINDRN